MENKKEWKGENLESIDNRAKDLYIIPSSDINSFKKDAYIEKWKDFFNNQIINGKAFRGKEHVEKSDFDTDDFFIPHRGLKIFFSKITKF